MVARGLCVLIASALLVASNAFVPAKASDAEPLIRLFGNILEQGIRQGQRQREEERKIRELQMHLTALGYYDRAIDGKIGPGTHMGLNQLLFSQGINRAVSLDEALAIARQAAFSRPTSPATPQQAPTPQARQPAPQNPTQSGRAPSVDISEKFASAATQLVGQMQGRGVASVVVLDFTDQRGAVRALGRYLAEELSFSLISANSTMSVIDRANLNRIMEELELSESGLIDPENARRLGEFVGADSLLFGTITPLGSNYVVQIRGISVSTGQLVAAVRSSIPVTNDFQVLWEDVLTGSAPAQSRTRADGGASTNSRGNTAAPPQRIVEATNNVEVALMSLTRDRQARSGRSQSVMGATFAIRNRKPYPLWVQFPADSHLVYQDYGGVTCLPSNRAGYQSNLRTSTSSRRTNSDAQRIEPQRELIVTVTGMLCNRQTDQSHGNLILRLLAQAEGYGISQENVSFQNVPLTGQH